MQLIWSRAFARRSNDKRKVTEILKHRVAECFLNFNAMR